jgi:type I restriction enzyme R subunit
MSLHKEITFETEICHHLAANGWLDAEAQRAGDLFQDNRTTLISAAVTGQIDVRNSVASDPAKRVSFANA